MTLNNYYDLAIIGGGASGLTAGITAGRSGMKTVILERLSRTGKKILATGNGRCNLSNNNITLADCETSLNSETVSKVLESFGNAEHFFRSLGLICRTDESGRIYPYSLNATAVLDALRLEISRLGVEETVDFKVTAIKKENGKFAVISEDGRKVIAENIIVTAGGCSGQSMGTDGQFFDVLRKLGHSVTPLKPALCPIKSNSPFLKSLKGLRVHANVSLLDSEKKIIASENGEVQFGEDVLSGICIFNLASKAEKGMIVSLNLMPEYSVQQVNRLIRHFQKLRSDTVAENLLTGILNKRIAQIILKECDIPLSKNVSEISVKQLNLLTEKLGNWTFEVSDKAAEWKNSQVTKGGISGTETDEFLQSTKIKGLSFAGEIIDINWKCGGYNLHWAWASAQYAVKSIKKHQKGD